VETINQAINERADDCAKKEDEDVDYIVHKNKN